MKTLLLDLKAYLADNNTRRNILSMRAAASGPQSRNDVMTFDAAMVALVSVPVIAANVVTVITTSLPLKIELTTPSGVVTLPAVLGLLVFPAYVSAIRVQNENTTDAVDAIIIQQ